MGNVNLGLNSIGKPDLALGGSRKVALNEAENRFVSFCYNLSQFLD